MRVCKEVNRLFKYKVSNDLSYKDLSDEELAEDVKEDDDILVNAEINVL